MSKPKEKVTMVRSILIAVASFGLTTVMVVAASTQGSGLIA